MCSTPFKWLFQEQRHEALVHTTVTRHAHVSAKQVTGKGKTDSRRAGSQPSPSRPWDIYQKLTFCWLIRKCTGQLSPIQKAWEKRKFYETLAKGTLLAAWLSHPLDVQLRDLATGCCDPGCHRKETCLLSFPPMQRKDNPNSTCVSLAMTKGTGACSSHSQVLEKAPASVVTQLRRAERDQSLLSVSIALKPSVSLVDTCTTLGAATRLL